MALGALTLSTTQGVQGRPFGAAIVGLTTGKVEVLGDGSPGFSTVNGRVSNNSLPYPISTVVLREYEPGVGQGYRDSRVDITASTREQLAAQAIASLGAGRALVNFRVGGDRQADGTINYTLKVQDDLGATASLTVGGPSLPSFTTLPSISGTPLVGQAVSSLTFTDGAVANGAISARSYLLAGTAVALSYVFQAGDAGKSLAFRNEATGPGGGPVPSTSAAVTVSAAPTLSALTLSNPVVKNTAQSGDAVAVVMGLTAGSEREVVGGSGRLSMSGDTLVIGSEGPGTAGDTITIGSTTTSVPQSETGPFSIVERLGSASRTTSFGTIQTTASMYPTANTLTSNVMRSANAQVESATMDHAIIIGYFRPDGTPTASSSLFGTLSQNGTAVGARLRYQSDGTILMLANGTANFLNFGVPVAGKWQSVAAQYSLGTGGQFGSDALKRARGILDGRAPIGRTVPGTASAFNADRFYGFETGTGGGTALHGVLFWWIWYGTSTDCPPINWTDPRTQAAIDPRNVNATTGVMTLYDDAGNPVTLTPKAFYHGKAADWQTNGLVNRGSVPNVIMSKVGTSGGFIPVSLENAVVTVGNPAAVTQSTFSQDGTSIDFAGVAKTGGQFFHGDWWIDNAAATPFTFTPTAKQGVRAIESGGTEASPSWQNGAMKNPGNAVATAAYPEPNPPFPPAKYEALAGNGDGSKQGFDSNTQDSAGIAYQHALNIDPGATGSPLTDTSGSFVKFASVPVVTSDGYRLALGSAAYTLAVPPTAAPDIYFRPGIAGAVKNLWVLANKANLSVSMFPNLSDSGFTPPDFFPVYYKLNRLHQVWLLNQRAGSKMVCGKHEESYGREYAQWVGRAMLLMCLNRSNAVVANTGGLTQKEVLAACLTQLGIDYTTMYEEGRVSSANGLGNTSSGRKLTLAVAAIVTGNSRILAASQAENWMPEQYQIGVVTSEMVATGYPSDMLGKPEWFPGRKYNGAGEGQLPWAPGSGYRHSWMQGMFAHYCAMKFVPQLATAANWPKFFEYVDRYYQTESGAIPKQDGTGTVAANSFPGDGASSIKNANVIYAFNMRQANPSYFA